MRGFTGFVIVRIRIYRMRGFTGFLLSESGFIG
jgi:hypothetical protein